MQVPAQSALATAGMKEGDVILKAGGKEVNTVADLLSILRAPTAGPVTFEIWRNQ